MTGNGDGVCVFVRARTPTMYVTIIVEKSLHTQLRRHDCGDERDVNFVCLCLCVYVWTCVRAFMCVFVTIIIVIINETVSRWQIEIKQRFCKYDCIVCCTMANLYRLRHMWRHDSWMTENNNEISRNSSGCEPGKCVVRPQWPSRLRFPWHCSRLLESQVKLKWGWVALQMHSEPFPCHGVGSILGRCVNWSGNTYMVYKFENRISQCFVVVLSNSFNVCVCVVQPR